MKRQWTIRRQLVESPDAARRWDRAYQCLLRWELTSDQDGPRESERFSPYRQEDEHAQRGLRAGIHQAPGPGADD